MPDLLATNPSVGNAPARTASPLERLVPELTLMVTSQLPPESQAALALTSKTMRTKSAIDVLNLQGEERYQLLKLLEKDGKFLTHFLCPFCRVFHYPKVPKWWRNLGHNPYCQPLEPTIPTDKPLMCDRVPFLKAISFGQVAAVLRSFRHSSQTYPLTMLSSSTRCTHPGNPAVKITSWSDPCVRKGRLILMTNWTYSVGATYHNALAAVPGLQEVVAYNPHLQFVCAHARWSGVYDFILRPEPGEPCASAQRYNCLWRHPAMCSTPNCGWVPAALTECWSCRTCCTDFAAARVDMPGSGHRALILKTWQDLGSGMEADDPQWTSYLNEAVAPHRTGSVRELYEGHVVSGSIA